MFEQYHRYFCPHCQIPLIGKSLTQLCINLNDHNDQKHPGESARWNQTGVRCSMYYDPPDNDSVFSEETPDEAAPRPEYTSPHGTCQNSKNPVDPAFPRLTPEDLTILKKGKVRWL